MCRRARARASPLGGMPVIGRDGSHRSRLGRVRAVLREWPPPSKHERVVVSSISRRRFAIAMRAHWLPDVTR